MRIRNRKDGEKITVEVGVVRRMRDGEKVGELATRVGPDEAINDEHVHAEIAAPRRSIRRAARRRYSE
jgi:hypothetical protein